MSIDESKLPQSVTISEPSSSLDAYGNPDGTLAVINSSVPCRITRNKHYNAEAGSEAGFLSRSTHLIFMNHTYNSITNTVKTGFQISTGSDIYIVQFVDDAPGGVEDHHQQIYCTKQVKD